PIYPIVLGMLGRQSANSDARQGLLLSAVYVVALASAFALVGAVVGWTGQNLQYYLQSPTTTIVLAAIFLLLALSSFGRFDIRLPGFITDRAASLKGRSGTVVSAAALGFTSSLIVGPCVTAPLAGALLYIGQGGDWRIGAIALFALGVGKGLPLIALATFGGGLLPKAGAWMESIRRLFGFGFAAMAVWTLSPLLPPNVDLALYLAIVGLAGVDLLMRLKEARQVSAALVLTATAPAMALFAGAPEADARIVLSTPAEPALDFAQTDSLPGLVKAFEAAKGRPVLVYVTAQWCVICRSIDRSVLPDERVVAALSDAHLVKLDVTDYGPEAQAMLARLKVAGPPTMLFFDGARREISGSRLVGKVSADQLAAAAETLLK
ncbi:cytochrome C biogenesis protein, partial [Salmonella enterica subsp. enterica serovar Virchow]|nr:cytochrome C biogenesis protein [Salmonella enterica subsp. enterica serovar Virchow]